MKTLSLALKTPTQNPTLLAKGQGHSRQEPGHYINRKVTTIIVKITNLNQSWKCLSTCDVVKASAAH